MAPRDGTPPDFGVLATRNASRVLMGRAMLSKFKLGKETMYTRKLNFMVPLTKQESEFAERLLRACEAVVEKTDRYADRSEWNAIYDDVELVPIDLREHVRRIDPLRLGPAGIAVAYTDADRGSFLTFRHGHFIKDNRAGLLVRHDGAANVRFVEAWLRETIRKFGHLEAVGFEWCRDCLTSSHVGAYGGGACIVTEERAHWLDTSDWVFERITDPEGTLRNEILPTLRQELNPLDQHYRQVRFLIPLTREEAEWAIRLHRVCVDAIYEVKDWKADPSSWRAIYDDVEVVPADLAEHVKRIDPCQIGGGTEFQASYEQDAGYREGLLVQGEECAGVDFIAAWVKEILRKFDHPRGFGFQIACDTVLFPDEAVGGGACFVTKDEIKWMFAHDWLDEQMQALDAQE